MSSTVEEVRALLRDFVKSPWRELHLRAGEWEVFLGKVGSGPNPLRRSDRTVAGLTDVIEAKAPHLGIVTSLLAVGTQVAVGAVVAVIDVLGRQSEIVAEANGRVSARLAQEGALIEFEQPLLAITPD